ncbi:relaxase/mobilization nuclease domain-containing protein [Alistipes putredinis]|uniref:relaxase/mobilization nuclease domain-containing protein n=2 Tax=Alistipes TaxID=239759 RepID=UPI003A844D0B
MAPSNRFVNTEKYLYLAKGYLICGIFVQLTENKPLLSRYLFSYIKAVTTRIIESLQLFNPVLTDKQLRKIACEYMERMGYGEQPYIVFKHKNISREHPHIVSMRVDEQGRKLPHDFEARRSMEILRDLERKYGLQPSIKGQELTDREGLRKVNYPEGNVKQQISSVVRSCLRNYKCSSYGEFRTLLERFNVSVEERTGTVDGRNYAGIVYGALTGDGYGTSTLFKSSKIGKDVGYKALQTYYAKSKERLKEPGALDRLRRTVRDAMSPHNTREEFRRLLKAENIDTVFRVNPVGRIYGVTFIDHNDGIVANGSVLGKEFSARVFNELFPTSQKEEQHTVEPDREQQHKQRRSAASSLSGIVDTVLDLADTQAYEEQQQLIQRRKKRKLHR